MQNEFHNQMVVDWAKQNLLQPVEIKLRFASRWVRTLIYLLLYLVPLLIIAGFIFLKLTGGANQGAGWGGIFLCGFVLLIPPSIIVVLGVLTQQKFVKSLDANGIKSSLGRRFFWKNLYYVDHVSKIYRVSGVTRKIEDNQLELVFADGKAIIPPLIYDRERIWSLINAMPVQVRDDGVIRSTAPAEKFEKAPTFDEIVRTMQELKVSQDENK